MRLISVALVITCLYACSSSKQANIQNQEAHSARLDSLSKFFNASSHNLYKIDTQFCDTGKYDSMTDMDLMTKNIPFRDDEQKKYEVIQYLKRLTKDLRNKEGAVSISNIKKILGEPTNSYLTRYTENIKVYEYKLDSGFECPNCTVGFHRIFESCDYLKFKENKELKIFDLSFEIYYSGLK